MKILPSCLGRRLPTVLLAFLLGAVAASGQSPTGAVLRLPSGVSAGWAVPATVEMIVTASGQAGFGARGGVGGIGSNGKPERGSPYFSMRVENGATFYKCDTVTGFPQRLGNSPFINRRGGSSFIAVKPTPKGNRKVWLCASVGAYRILGGVVAEWEYQIRYFSGDPDAGGVPTLEIGTVPNADVFVGEALSGCEVELKFAGLPNLVGAIGDRQRFPTGYRPNAVGTVSVAVTNLGSAAVQGPLEVGFYLSADTRLDKGTDDPLGKVTVGSVDLPPGGSLVVSGDFLTLPGVLPELPWFFLAAIDLPNAIAEENEDDNVASAPPLLPALVLDLQPFAFPEARPGRTGVVDVVVRNLGTGPFPGGDAEVDLWVQGQVSRHVLSLPKVDAGGSVARRLEGFVLPKDLFGSVQPPEGTPVTVRAELDPRDLLPDLFPSVIRADEETLVVRGFDVFGKVVTVTRHRPVPDVEVAAYLEKGFGPASPGNPVASARTDESGSYRISGLPYESYIVAAAKEDWVFSALDDFASHRIQLLDAFPGDFLVRKGEVEAFNYFGYGKVLLKSARTKYKGTPYFVAGIGLEVPFEFEVDWGSQEPGKVVLAQGDLEEAIEATGERVTKTLDVGKLFEPCEPVMARAVSAEGIESEAIDGGFVMLGKPSWLALPLLPVVGSDPLYYKLGIEFDLDTPELKKFRPEALTSIPVIGEDGAWLEWLPKVEIELRNDAIKGTLTTSGEPLKLGLGKLGKLPFAITGDLGWTHSSAECRWLFSSVAIGSRFNTPPLGFVYPLPVAWPVFLRGMVEGELTLMVGYQGEATGKPGLRFVASPKANGKFSVETGVPYLLSAGGFGGVEVGGSFEAPPGEWSGLQVTGQVGWTLTVFGYRSESSQLRWEYPPKNPGGTQAWDWESFWNQPFVPMDRSYLGRWSYLPFDDGRRARILLGADGGDAAAAPRTHVVQTAGFPESQADLCALGEDVVLAWLSDDPVRSAGNRTVAMTSRRSGGVWSAPQALANDGTGDFHPRLRQIGGDGGPLYAVWEDLKEPLPDDAGLTNLMRSLEISVARFDPVPGRWVDAERLTDNGHFDRTPRLVVRRAGNPQVFWVANPGNDLLGSAQSPNRLMTSRLEADGWTPPEVVAEVAGPLFYYDAVDSPGGLRVVLSVDLDGTPATVADHELFLVSEENGRWGPVRRLTSDAVADDSPQLVSAAGGAVWLVWLRDGEISLVADFDFGRREVAFRDEYSSNLANFRLAANAEGRLGVAWIEPSTHLADIWGVFRDAKTAVWSGRIQLTDDAPVERGLAVALTPAGRWFGAFNHVAPPPPGAFAALAQAQPVPGDEADLVVAELPLGVDVAVRGGAVKAVPPNPRPGEAVLVQFAVTNRSAWPVASVPVVLFRGDPARGGSEVARTNLAVLGGGAGIGGTLPWVIPANAATVDLWVVVDPSGTLGDRDPADNGAGVSLMRADLAVDRIYWTRASNDVVRVTAEVANLGVLPSSEAALEFRSGTAEGPPVARFPVPALAPGERLFFEVLQDLPPGGGRLEVTAALASMVHPDFDPANNAATLSIAPPRRAGWRITGLLRPAGGGFEVRFPATAGKEYILEASEDLSRWTEVKRVTPTGADGAVVDDRPGGVTSRFYRLRSGP